MPQQDSDYASGQGGVGGTVETAEITNDSVTYSKMQNVSATDKVLGRASPGAGDVEEIDCTAAGRALLDDASAGAQRTTLGLGTGDSPTFTAVTTVGSMNCGTTLGAGQSLYVGGAVGTGVPILDSGGAPNLMRMRSGADAVSPCWIGNEAGKRRVAADATNATATLANLTDLTEAVIAARHYVGRYVFKCSDSVAAEGIRFDFGGGTATMTAFAAGAGLVTGGTTVASVTVSSALATNLIWTTITGETWLVVEVAFTVNGAGTFIPRFAQSTHTSGTATVSRGSTGRLVDSA